MKNRSPNPYKYYVTQLGQKLLIAALKLKNISSYLSYNRPVMPPLAAKWCVIRARFHAGGTMKGVKFGERVRSLKRHLFLLKRYFAGKASVTGSPSR